MINYTLLLCNLSCSRALILQDFWDLGNSRNPQNSLHPAPLSPGRTLHTGVFRALASGGAHSVAHLPVGGRPPLAASGVPSAGSGSSSVSSINRRDPAGLCAMAHPYCFLQDFEGGELPAPVQPFILLTNVQRVSACPLTPPRGHRL